MLMLISSHGFYVYQYVQSRNVTHKTMILFVVVLALPSAHRGTYVYQRPHIAVDSSSNVSMKQF